MVSQSPLDLIFLEDLAQNLLPQVPDKVWHVLATEILGKILVASSRTLGCCEEPLLSSGWTLIGSELSSPNFN